MKLQDKIYCLKQIVDTKASMPILQHVAFNEGYAVATDLETSIYVPFKKAGDINACMPIKMIEKAFKGRKESELSFNTDTSGDTPWIDVLFSNKKVRVSGLNCDDFPTIPTVRNDNSFSLDIDFIDKKLPNILNAVSPDNLRRNLSGVYFENVDNKLRLVATDEHRLHYVDTGKNNNAVNVLIPGDTIKKARLIAKKLKVDKVDFGIDYNGDNYFAKITIGDVIIIVRCIDADFPDYRQVTPEELPTSIEYNREEFIEALKFLSEFNSKKNGSFKLSPNCQYTHLTTVCPEEVETEQKISQVISGVNNIEAIGFKDQYLIEALNCYDRDTITLRLNKELSPGMIQHDNFTCVIMPMRV